MKTDEELRKDVLDEIKWDPEIGNAASTIDAYAKNGSITLSGKVDTFRKKNAAECAAKRVYGVQVVASDIEVDFENWEIKNDTEILVAARNALKWNSAISEGEVEVRVLNGWIYLSGKVEWGFERLAAERCVSDLVGVKGVTNSIEITTQSINVRAIKNKIASAFHRNATIDSSNITIDTSGNKITLHGSVRSWVEKKEAENIAWSTPGVLAVDNQIDIDVASAYH